MDICTAQYPVRCNNNTCGLLCNLRISHMIINYYLFWTCPHDQNHLPTPMYLISRVREVDAVSRATNLPQKFL